jgi:hypothetical protein
MRVKLHLQLGPVEQLGNLTELDSSTTSRLLVRPLTCHVSGIDSLGTAPLSPPRSVQMQALGQAPTLN